MLVNKGRFLKNRIRGLVPGTSLLSSSCSAGCTEVMVTPGMWGRQQGGVRAIGELRHSKRNFRS